MTELFFSYLHKNEIILIRTIEYSWKIKNQQQQKQTLKDTKRDTHTNSQTSS